jgi:flagellar assembly protein FliH
MAISHLLEDFSAGSASGNIMTLMSDVALEDQRLASFEQGYSAGWEDAFEAQENDQSRITGKLADNLGDLSFTYHEAVSQLMTSVEPVFYSIIDLVLPEIMMQTFGQHIVEQLCEMVRNQVSGPASLIVPVGIGATLTPILARDLTMQVNIVEDISLEDGRAYIRLGSTEREINVSALLESIREALDAFAHHSNKEIRHG